MATPPMLQGRRRKRVLPALVVASCLVPSACAYRTVIRTEPAGAEVFVDGERLGASPVVVERGLGTFGEMKVHVEMEAFEESTLVVERNEWFLWPAALAITPLLGIGTLIIPVAGPFLCGGWMVVSSPTLLALGFLRRYPGEVVIPLQPKLRLEDGFVFPTDDWTIPDDYSPNPLPPLPDEEREPTPLPQRSDPQRPDDKAPNPPPQGLFY